MACGSDRCRRRHRTFTSTGDDGAGEQNNAAEQNTEAPGDTATAAKFGQPARDGKFEFTITKVSRAKTIGDEYLSHEAQGEFVILDVTVKNIGNEPQTLFDSNQYLYDAKGNQYTADSEAAMYASADGNTSVFIEDINPGNTVKGKIVFDMPAGVAPAKAELHDSAYSGGVVVSLK